MAQKRASIVAIIRLNIEREEQAKTKWELENQIRRLVLRQLPGRKPV
jgi:hypothetical protein